MLRLVSGYILQSTVFNSGQYRVFCRKLGLWSGLGRHTSLAQCGCSDYEHRFTIYSSVDYELAGNGYSQ